MSRKKCILPVPFWRLEPQITFFVLTSYDVNKLYWLNIILLWWLGKFQIALNKSKLNINGLLCWYKKLQVPFEWRKFCLEDFYTQENIFVNGDALEHFCGTFLHCRLPAQPSEVTCEVVSLEVARQCDSVFLLLEVFRWWYNPCIYHEYFFRTVQPMEYMGNSYFVLKNQVIKAERRMLKVSGCHCCHNI